MLAALADRGIVALLDVLYFSIDDPLMGDFSFTSTEEKGMAVCGYRHMRRVRYNGHTIEMRLLNGACLPAAIS